MLDVRVRLSAAAQRPFGVRERVHVHHVVRRSCWVRVVLLVGREFCCRARKVWRDCGLRRRRSQRPETISCCAVLSPYAIDGGVILTPGRTPASQTREEGAIERLLTLESGTSADHARDWIRSQALRVFGVRDLASGLQLDPAEAQQLVESLRESGAVSELAPGRFVDSEEADGLLQAIQEALAEYHAANPLRAGMPLHHLQRTVGNPAPEVMQWALGVLKKGELIVAESGGWRSRGYEPRVEESQRALLTERMIAEAEGSRPRRLPMQEQAFWPDSRRDSKLTATCWSWLCPRATWWLIGDFVMRTARAGAGGGRSVAELYRRSGAFGVSEVRDLWALESQVCLCRSWEHSGRSRSQRDVRVIGGHFRPLACGDE